MTALPAEPTRLHPHITDGERLLLAMLAAGLNHDQIARRVGRSHSGVSNHLARVYQRIGAVNAASAVAIAIRDGLISVGGPK